MGINYEASVPIDQRAPFSVQVDPNKPPGDRFRDYKPHTPSTLVVLADDKVRKKNFMRPPVSRYETDYVSPEDSVVRRKNEKASIVTLARTLYEGEKNRRDIYAAAKKLSDFSPPDSVSDDVVKARKIVERGLPMTKEQAMEKAARQFYGLRS